MKKQKILLFGKNFMSYPTSQEKNMWLQFVQHAKKDFAQIIIISIDNFPQKTELIDNDILLYHIKPCMPGERGRPKKPHLLNRKISSAPFGQLYQTLTVYHTADKIASICREHQIDAVHYMQPFGFFMKHLKKKLPQDTSLSISFSTYIPRMKPLTGFYNFLKKQTLIQADKVFVPNKALKKQALEFGIKPSKIFIVPWCIEPSEFEYVENKTEEIQPLKIASPLFLSTGPIQEIGTDKDFELFLDITKNLPGTKILALKPDKDPASVWKNIDAEAKNFDVTIKCTDYQEFQSLLKAATFLISPVADLNRTVPPPLTWLESLSLGTPVITTPVPGSEFLGKFAPELVSCSAKELHKNILTYLNNRSKYAELRKRLSYTVRTTYNIEKMKLHLLKYWSA